MSGLCKVAFYSGKHSVFRINYTRAIGGTSLTQFGCALHGLNIDILYANSPQAKGRVERVNKTLQDRLVKELRLEGIDTLEAGNAYPPAFMERFNAKFAQAPADGTVAIKYQGVDRPYRVFDKVRHVEPADIASNKRLGAALQFAHDQQREHPVTRSTCAPTRRGQQRLAEERFRQTNPALLQGLAELPGA